jgi:hypothetical protein
VSTAADAARVSIPRIPFRSSLYLSENGGSERRKKNVSHDYSSFLWGVLAGSIAELLIIFASRWLWDRYLWLRWFSQ